MPFEKKLVLIGQTLCPPPFKIEKSFFLLLVQPAMTGNIFATNNSLSAPFIQCKHSLHCLRKNSCWRSICADLCRSALVPYFSFIFSVFESNVPHSFPAFVTTKERPTKLFSKMDVWGSRLETSALRLHYKVRMTDSSLTTFYAHLIKLCLCIYHWVKTRLWLDWSRNHAFALRTRVTIK